MITCYLSPYRIHSMPTALSIPTTAQFKTALLAVRPKGAHLAMLEAHYRAPGHQITATQLATAAGSRGYSGANIQYGNLGKDLASALSIDSPMRNERGDPIWTGVIASGTEGAADGAHYLWTMRPELVTALTELPWGFTKPPKK